MNTTIEIEKLTCPTLIITGDEDRVCPPALADEMKERMRDVRVVVLEGVGHWHIFEDAKGVAEAVRGFL
jgi:pimeloyl-ACP methyl ester carboxylesterase